MTDMKNFLAFVGLVLAMLFAIPVIGIMWGNWVIYLAKVLS